MILREFVNMIGFKINERQFRKTEAQVNGLLNRMENFGRKASFALTLPFVGLSVLIGKQLSEFEQLDVAFETMIGNAEEADKLVRDMLAFAAKTPFQINEIGNTVKQLLATGSSASMVLDELKSLGDVAAGLSVPISRLALNFGQVRAQGKLTGRELRDFAVAGVPLREVLAKNLNVTTAAIQDMVSAGSIGFDDVKKAFRIMTSEGGRFANLMTKQAKALGGLWSNFLDLIALSIKQMEKKLLPIFKKFVNILIKMLQVFDNISADLKIIIFAFSALLAVIGPLTLAFVLFVNIGKAVQMTLIGIATAAKAANISLFAMMAKFALMGVAIVAVIALLLLFIEDLIVFARGGDSFIGRFLEPWLTLAPKVKAALMPFWIILQDMWKNIKRVFNGITAFITGIFTDDIEKASKGLEEIIIQSLDFIGNLGAILVPIIWRVLKVISTMVFNWVPKFFKKLNDLIANSIFAMIKTISNALQKLSNEFWAKLKGTGIDKVLRFMGSSPGDFRNSLGIGESIGANSSNSTNSNQVNVTANVTVPEGTQESQMQFINTGMKTIAEEVFQNQLNNLSFGIQGVE